MLRSESEEIEILEEEDRELEIGRLAEEREEPSGNEIEDVSRFPLM